MHARLPSTVAFVAVAVLATTPTCDAETCTLEARVSVEVLLVDSAGEAVYGASVSATADGEQVPCENYGDPNGPFWCGQEVAGVFEIRASAPRYADATQAVTVRGDGCHVHTESVTMTLDGPDCAGEAQRPSIHVSVSQKFGDELQNVLVEYGRTGEALAPCEASDGAWLCGVERKGDFQVRASADGQAIQMKEATVEAADACHVQTVEMVFILYPSG